MMKSTKVINMILAASACIVSSNALATPDLNAPAWRYEEGTTFQLWQFGDDTNPAETDVYVNDNGTPTATINYDKPFVPWIPTDHAHQGVWYIEQSDSITLHIPSSQSLDEVKQLYLQMVYYTAVDGDVFTLASESAEVTILQTYAIDEYYTYGAFSITLTGADAMLEDILLSPVGCTIYVDSIALDTIPEPITIALLGLGSIMIRRKKSCSNDQRLLVASKSLTKTDRLKRPPKTA